MTGDLVTRKSGVLKTADGTSGMPALIVRAGGHAEKGFLAQTAESMH
jgi:hypothetical protein